VTILAIDTAGYAAASRYAGIAGAGLAEAALSAARSLQGSGGMAGWDAGGTDWAASYDPAAAQVLAACGALAATCAETARALAQAGQTFAQAEHAASLGTSTLEAPLPDAPHGDPCAPGAPAAAGGNPGYPPAGWDLLAGLAGVVWPNADPGALRSAAASWRVLADGVDDVRRGPLLSAESAVAGLVAADLGYFAERAALTATMAADIADAARELAAACEGYARAVEDAHGELTHEALMFVAECAALAAAGAVLSFVTMGGAAGIAALVGTARAAQVAARVTQILARLTVVAAHSRPAAAHLAQLGRLASRLGPLGAHPVISRAGARVLAPAVRQFTALRGSAAASHLRPVAAMGRAFLDSRTASVLANGPAAVLREEAVYRLRQRAFGSWAARGSTADWALHAVGQTSWGATRAFRAVTWARAAQGRLATAAALGDRVRNAAALEPRTGAQIRPRPGRPVEPPARAAPAIPGRYPRAPSSPAPQTSRQEAFR
jgi:hypothetical protein